MYVKMLHLKMHAYLRTKYIFEPVFDERGLMITMLTMTPVLITETRTFALVPHRTETLVMIVTPSFSSNPPILKPADLNLQQKQPISAL